MSKGKYIASQRIFHKGKISHAHSKRSWNLLRAMRRNQSSANLKKEADGRDMLRKAGLESSIVTRESDEESLHGDTRILHVSENGCDVMVMEMVSGRLHVVAGTTEKLFLKLADETTQGRTIDKDKAT